MFNAIKYNIENNETIHMAKKIWPGFELFLISGPTLIGWVIGMVKYEYRDERFKISIQSFALFLIYIALLVLNQIIVFTNIANYKYYSLYADSFFCFLYLLLGLYFYIGARRKNPYLHGLIIRVLDRLNSKA
ncbi:MAG: hypothetical protein OEZ13_02630 [Spirochaetia bacterium]|nr:hypothetical protein [Spirochaetia bacterium]